MKILGLLEELSQKKRMICLVGVALAAVLLFGVICSGNKTVAKPINLEEFGQLPAYPVQEVRAWGQGEVRLSDEPRNMEGYRLYKYRMSQDVLEDYLALLQEEGYALVGEHHQTSFLGSYQSYGLLRTDATDIPTIDLMYEDIPCHVNIWKCDNEWWVEVADGLTLCDMGLRREGTETSILPQGESVAAGLKQIRKGYETSDGRLRAKLGQAEVICDGKKLAGTATWKRSGKRIFVTVEAGDELTAEIMFYEDEVEQNDLFRLETIEEYPASFTLTLDDEKIGAGSTGALSFHCVSLRFMHLDEDGDVVLYLYAQPMNTRQFPETVEFFCVVNTTPEEKKDTGSGGGFFGGSNDKPFVPEFAKLDCLTCGGDGDCNSCGGYGEVERYAGGGDTVRSKCSSCHGSGNCRTCGGSGKR
jgi:hypothetical protein